jgi:hypothetical protein
MKKEPRQLHLGNLGTNRHKIGTKPRNFNFCQNKIGKNLKQNSNERKMKSAE